MLSSPFHPRGYCVVVNMDRPDVDFLQMNYDLPWLNHYVENSLMMDDPTVTFARETSGHATWSELRARYPKTRTLKDARDFGIGEGNTLSIEIDGVRSLVSGAGYNWSPIEVERARFALHTIHLMNVRRPEG